MSLQLSLFLSLSLLIPETGTYAQFYSVDSSSSLEADRYVSGSEDNSPRHSDNQEGRSSSSNDSEESDQSPRISTSNNNNKDDDYSSDKRNDIPETLAYLSITNGHITNKEASI